MEKYEKELKIEEKETNFFSSLSSAAVAVDVSGSTYGQIMENQKKIITKILSGTNCENLLKNIIAWDSEAKIKQLEELDSSGGTYPHLIFEKLGKNVENLIVTTDGIISRDYVNKTRDSIKPFINLKNIICISFQEATSPSDLNIAVFYPFLEHVKKFHGNFYLFFYKNDRLYLLLKHTSVDTEEIFKSPPAEYTANTKWEEIPNYDPDELKKIIVTSITIEEGYICIPKINKLFNLNMLQKDVLDFKNKDD